MNIYSEIGKNKRKTYFFMFVFAALISLFFYLAGVYFGDPQFFFFIGLIISAGSSFFSYYYSDSIVLKMTHARPATKEEFFDFYTVTENLCIASGVPMPRLYVVDDDALNAFATGRNPEHAVITATTGILKKLERSEIEGVIAHELSHVKNYDTFVMTIVTVLAGTLVYMADFMMRIMFWGRSGSSDNDNKGGPLGLVIFLLMTLLMPLMASLIQMSISRKREFLADASGSLITRNPDGLADALQKISGDPTPFKYASNATAHLFISNPFKSKKAHSFFNNLFSTHPPVEERIRILREM